MSKVIDRNELRSLVDQESAQLVEVLPSDEYESLHIAGAINIPLKVLAAQAARLDRALPVVVYCNDFQ